MNEKKILLSLLLIILFTNIVKAQETVVSIGVKLGYFWGNDGGSFNAGFEASVVFWENRNNLYPLGIVFDYDYITHMKSSRIHLGIEKNISLFGVDIGPTIMFGEENNFGFSIIPYAGFLFIPYGEFSFFNGYTMQGVGAYIKFPIQSSKNFRIGD